MTLVNEEVPDDVEEGYSDEGRYLIMLKWISVMLLINGRKWTEQCKCSEHSSLAGRSKGIVEMLTLKCTVCVCV